MVVIFLDIDGVLLPLEQRSSCSIEEIVAQFDQPALVCLNQLIAAIEGKGHETGIVISSDWRQGRSVYELKEILKQHAFSHKIIGKTTDKTDYREADETRGARIQEWLAKHHNWPMADFVIFDDNCYDIDTLFKKNFVHCTEGVLSVRDVILAHYILQLKKPPKLPPLTQVPYFHPLMNPPAVIAAREKRLQNLKTLVEADPTLLNQQDTCDQTPLLAAVANNDVKMVRYLLKKNADPDLKIYAPGSEYNYSTALYIACKKKNMEITKMLLEAGSSIKLIWQNAVMRQDVGVVCWLHEQGYKNYFQFLLLGAKPEEWPFTQKCIYKIGRNGFSKEFLYRLIENALETSQHSIFQILIVFAATTDSVPANFKQRQIYMVKFVNQLIHQANNPLELINKIYKLFLLEMQNPLLTKQQGLKNAIVGYKWDQKNASPLWETAIINAKKKILAMAAEQDFFDDEEVKIFLSIKVQHRISCLFSATNYLAKYESIKEQRHTATSVLQMSNVKS